MGRPFYNGLKCKICENPCHLGRTFCSHRCANLDRTNLHAVGNKWAYRGEKAGRWAHYKRMQKLLAPGPCTICGSDKQSIIHHIDHNPKNTVIENLQRMCRACHAKHHKLRKHINIIGAKHA